MPKKLLSIALLFVTALTAEFATAHSGDEPPMFVAPYGVDAGKCQDIDAPCASIGYALSKVGKGGEIRVATGNYIVTSPDDLFFLINGNVDISGGFSLNSFMQPAVGRTTLVGVPLQYAEAMSERGFHVIADQKAVDRATEKFISKNVAVHASLRSSLPATECTGGTANGLPCQNVDLLSHLAQADISARPGEAADVWGFMDLNTHREYAIVGFDIGTAIIDVTDAENPREVGFIDGQSTVWRDIKVFQFWNVAEARWNAHAYITTDGSVTDGLFIVDLSGLPHSVSRLNYSSDFLNAHNVYATSTDFGTGLTLSRGEPTIIVAGSNRDEGPYRAYSVNNPSSPRFEAMPGSGRPDYMHDAASMIITDSRKNQCLDPAAPYCELLFDFNEFDFYIWDITDTNNPLQLSSRNYPNVAYVHSGWWSEDKQYLYVHDELDELDFNLNTTLRIFSLADLTNPVSVGQWLGPTTAIDHNGFVRGNRYYMSNYTRGLTILDITDGANPTLAGRIDTFPGSDARGFAGAWGAYPFFPSGNIAISDIETGLYMVSDQTLDVPEGKLAFAASSYSVAEGNQIQLTVRRIGGSSGSVSADFEIVPVTGSVGDNIGGVGFSPLTWTDGDNSDRTITLLTSADPDTTMERVIVKLVAPEGGATLAAGANVASLYFSEPTAAAEVAFGAAEISTAERGFATAVAVLERTGSAIGAASVDFAVTGGDATAGVDFLGATTGTVSWTDGDADPKWIEFPIVDDGTGAGEDDEFFELTLSNATGTAVGGQATLRVNIGDGTGANTAPNAIAGGNQSVNSGANVTLNGSASNDPDGDTLSYQWAQVSGTTVTLANADSASATFTAPTVNSDTLLQFSLTVSDGKSQDVAQTAVTVRRVTNNNTNNGGGGGGGSLEWLLLVLLSALLVKRVLLDNRLLAIRARRDNIDRHTR